MEKKSMVTVENYMDRMTFIAYNYCGIPRVYTVYRNSYSSDNAYQRACDEARADAEYYAQ